MSLLDAHPTPKPGAHWPDGFRENAQAIADKVAAERDGRPRLVKTGSGYADHIGDAIAGYEPTPEIVPKELGARPARVARAGLTVTLLGALAASTITPEAPAQERRP